MQIVATISFEHYKAVLVAIRKKHQDRNKKTRWLNNIVVIVVLAFSLTIVIQTSSAEAISFYGAFLLFLLAIWVWSRWRTENCLKQTYEVQKKQLNGQVMDIDESGISGEWEDRSASYQYKWSAFESYLNLPNEFLFLPNSASFVRIPKESLSLDEQQTIKNWATKIAPTQPPTHP